MVMEARAEVGPRDGAPAASLGERASKASLRDLTLRLLAVLCREWDPATEVRAVAPLFAVPLVDQETGEVLDRDSSGGWTFSSASPRGTWSWWTSRPRRGKYTDLQVETSLRLSVYSYAAAFGRFADREEVRLRFDVLTKTKQPELCRYWTTRDRAANVRLFRLASEVLRAIEAGVFHSAKGLLDFLRSRGRRCCAGCLPWTCSSVRAAAAGGGSWGCTRGARACGSCSSGWGS